MFGITSSQYNIRTNNFLSRGSFTNETHRLAIEYLVRELSFNNYWSKFSAIYPFVGATSGNHSLNLISSSFTISWVGTVTHSTTGVLFNGSTGYGNTNTIASNLIGQNSSVGFYCRSLYGTGIELGTRGGSNADLMLYVDTVPTFKARMNSDTGTTIISNPITTCQGLFSATRFSSSSLEYYRNGVSIGTATTAPNGPPNQRPYIGAYNNGADVAGNFSNKELALVYFASTPLTAAEQIVFYNIVQQYQSLLGRSVN